MNIQPELNHVLQRDLKGFKLAFGFWAELTHTCLGVFPALYKDNIILCLTHDLMNAVIRGQIGAPCKVHKELILLSPDGKSCYLVRLMTNQDKEMPANFRLQPLVVFEEADFQHAEKGDVRWAPGLLSLSK